MVRAMTRAGDGGNRTGGTIMSNPNDPAFPIHVPEDTGWKNDSARTYEGMTIRQQFVMAAMQGLCARSSGLGFSETIKSAIEIADAALAEEAKTRGEA